MSKSVGLSKRCRIAAECAICVLAPYLLTYVAHTRLTLNDDDTREICGVVVFAYGGLRMHDYNMTMNDTEDICTEMFKYRVFYPLHCIDNMIATRIHIFEVECL